MYLICEIWAWSFLSRNLTQRLFAYKRPRDALSIDSRHSHFLKFIFDVGASWKGEIPREILFTPAFYRRGAVRGVAYLCGREADDASEVFALRGRQVSLLPKPPLQFVSLCLREQNPSFAFLGASGLSAPLGPRLVLSLRLLVVLLSVHQVVFAILPHEGRPHEGWRNCAWRIRSRTIGGTSWGRRKAVQRHGAWVEVRLLFGATSRGVWGHQGAGRSAVRADLLLVCSCKINSDTNMSGFGVRLRSVAYSAELSG